jgi:hypothetical protein
LAHEKSPLTHLRCGLSILVAGTCNHLNLLFQAVA